MYARRTMRAALGLTALALVAAGCGGGDRLSHAEYLKQADAICAKYEKRLHALPDPETTKDLKALVDKGLPIAREGNAELKDLKPPEDLKAKVDEWHKRNERNLELIENLGKAADEGGEERIQSLASEADKNEQEADRLAREMGLTDCAEDG
jgi:hypothetical protein